MANCNKESRLDESRYMGLTTLEAARAIVEENQRIKEVSLRAYLYKFNEPSGANEISLFLPRADFIPNGRVEEFVDKFDSSWNIALDSRVRLEDDRRGHFPMLDLAPRKSPRSLNKVLRRFEEILVPEFGGGVILETKKSYHYLGNCAFLDRRYNEFLGRALISSIVTIIKDPKPNRHTHIADYRYIGHSLIRGTTGLRITARAEKSVIPTVVAIV